MNDELLVLSNLDQPIDVDNEWILRKVDEIIQDAITKRNPRMALETCRQLIGISKISGIGLAKLLYKLRENWGIFELEEEFNDAAYLELGLHRHTTDRYVTVWDMFENNSIPERLEETMQQQNIKSLIPIGKALQQGYVIDDEQWERLAAAPDYTSVSKIIREEVKQAPPRKGSVQLYMDEIGSVWAISGGEKYFTGSLEITSDEPIVQKAIKRIIDNSGILQR